MELFHQYDPSHLLPKPPKGSIGYSQFLTVDSEWSGRIARIQEVQREFDGSVEDSQISMMINGQVRPTAFRLPSQLLFQPLGKVNPKRLVFTVCFQNFVFIKKYQITE